MPSQSLQTFCVFERQRGYPRQTVQSILLQLPSCIGAVDKDLEVEAEPFRHGRATIFISSVHKLEDSEQNDTSANLKKLLRRGLEIIQVWMHQEKGEQQSKCGGEKVEEHQRPTTTHSSAKHDFQQQYKQERKSSCDPCATKLLPEKGV
jgi:hypothetical protein